MMATRSIAVVALITAAPIATPRATQTPAAAIDRLAKVRAAMGGASALAAVKTLQISLHDRDRVGTMPGNTSPQVRFSQSRSEVSLLLPDHLLWKTEYLEPTPTAGKPWGFAGPHAIGPGAVDRPVVTPRILATFGYFMFPLILETKTVFPFTLLNVRGDTLSFTDPNKADVMVELDPATNLPQRIRYDLVERSLAGELTGERFPQRIEIGGYAAVGSLMLPKTLTTYRGATLLQERTIDAIVLNPKLTPADFK